MRRRAEAERVAVDRRDRHHLTDRGADEHLVGREQPGEREHVLDGFPLRELEQETVEGVFPVARLFAADEVFVCSSIREVMPVASVDGKPFGLGPAAEVLQQELRRRAAS